MKIVKTPNTPNAVPFEKVAVGDVFLGTTTRTPFLKIVRVSCANAVDLRDNQLALFNNDTDVIPASAELHIQR